VAPRITSRAALDLDEVSGFAVRERDGGRELLCVGDHDHRLLVVPLGDDGAVDGEGIRHDLRPLAPEPGASGFEGVACDGAGRVLVLQEGPSRVLVLAPELDRLERVVGLVVARDQPGFGPEWAEDDNARGEGLLPMARGHLLVVKQKEPVCLIEFGPPRDEPLGVGPRSLLGREEELELPAAGRARGLRFEVLGWWLLSRRAAKRLESANDLALDGRRRLLLVSSLSHRVARIATPLDPAEHEAAVEEDWRVPELGGGRSRPEALCLIPGAVLVGYDRRDAGDNLAVLGPLD
jgi:hypothetical protein